MAVVSFSDFQRLRAYVESVVDSSWKSVVKRFVKKVSARCCAMTDPTGGSVRDRTKGDALSERVPPKPVL